MEKDARGKERKFKMAKGRKGPFNPLSGEQKNKGRPRRRVRGNERPFQIQNERTGGPLTRAFRAISIFVAPLFPPAAAPFLPSRPYVNESNGRTLFMRFCMWMSSLEGRRAHSPWGSLISAQGRKRAACCCMRLAGRKGKVNNRTTSRWRPGTREGRGGKEGCGLSSSG